MNKNIFKKIGGEFLFGILEVLVTYVETKIGFGIFLLITGLALVLSPKSEEMNSLIMNSIGSILIIFSVLLFKSRIREIKNQKNNL